MAAQAFRENPHCVWSQQRAVTDFSREVSGQGWEWGKRLMTMGQTEGGPEGGAFPTDPPWHVLEET